jgi:PAS domain S-box-containing protein
LLGILLLMQVFVIIAVRAMQKGRMLQAVRESETRLRGIIGSINEGMFVTDRGGQVKLWNPVMQRSFGRSSADAVGLPVKDIFGGGNAEPLLGAILVATRTGIAGQLSEFADEDADGEARVTRRASSRSNGA